MPVNHTFQIAIINLGIWPKSIGLPIWRQCHKPCCKGISGGVYDPAISDLGARLQLRDWGKRLGLRIRPVDVHFGHAEEGLQGQASALNTICLMVLAIRYATHLHPNFGRFRKQFTGEIRAQGLQTIPRAVA